MMLAYCNKKWVLHKYRAGMMLEKIHLLSLNFYIQHIMGRATGTHWNCINHTLVCFN